MPVTLAEAAERTGVSEEGVRRLWRALGFAIPAPDELAFTDGDLEMITLMQRGYNAGLVDRDTVVRLARAVGQNVARMADWQVSTLAPRAEEAGVSPAETVAVVLGEDYDRLLIYAWHRHLAAATARFASSAEGDEAATTVSASIGFADIVQFSKLSNEIDEERIGDLVELFETRASYVVSNAGGRVIKTLGDSVLFLAEDATAAMDIAHGIIDVIGNDSRLPDVRAGVATGTVILQFGDVFGPPVNLAARLTGIARRNRVITDQATARLLSPTKYDTRALTARPVRGFGILEPIAVRRL